MATLTINHYINQSNSFITDIRNNRNAYYVFASRSQPWANSSGGNDDSAVLASNNSIAQVEQQVYNNVLFGKLLKDADVINVVPRYNWAANTVYIPYDQNDSNLYDKQFFVITDKYEVYKCIDNNNGANSYVKPSLTSATGTFKTGDGYIWKYMYTVSSASNTKFTTTEYIPVDENLAVQGNATPGSIDLIKITDGGNGYSVSETGYIAGVPNSFRIQLPLTSSSVDGYYTNSSIYLKSGFGSGQIREIESYNGTSKQIVVAGNPLEVYNRMDLANAAGTITTGYYVEQTFDDLSYLYVQGYFNTNSTVSQSDTGTSGGVLSANSTVIQVARTNPNTSFQLGFPVVDTSQSGQIKQGNVAVGNVGACNIAFVTSAGSGYSANAVVTITPSGLTGTGAVANAQVNSSGRVSAVLITTQGNGYFTAPSVTIAPPSAQTITANTVGVNSTADVILIGSANSRFLPGDRLYYGVPAGNTAISGLIGNTFYYVTFSNTSSIALSNTSGGTNVNLTAAATDPGQQHTLTGETATAAIFCDNQIVRGTANTLLNSTANGYSNGDYIRVGANTTSNIRRVANAVNTTILIVTSPFNGLFTATANLHYKMTTAAELSSIVPQGANGYISETNLTSVQLAISNSSLAGVNFTVGENVNLTNSARVDQGASGTVAFANSSTVVLSDVLGDWLVSIGGTQLFASGDSSLQLSQIDLVTSNPNITIEQQNGLFKLGYPVYFKANVFSSSSGNAIPVAQFSLPNDRTEYQIGPTVKITGDGVNAIGIGVVNTSVGSVYNVVGVDMIDPGTGYTQANVQIYANNSYGSGAAGRAIISPVNGHGYDPVTELGGRYVGVSSTFDGVVNESYEFPGYGDFRQVGIIQNPKFKDIKVTLTDFDRVNMTLTNFTGGWVAGEVVTQPTTDASGILVSGNATSLQLKSVKGTFSPSNTIVNLVGTDNVRLTVTGYGGNTNWAVGEVVAQSSTKAAGVVVSGNSTSLMLKNVSGVFNTSATVNGFFSNSYATVSQTNTTHFPAGSISGFFSNSSANVVTSGIIRFPVGNSAAFITQSNSGSTGVITQVVNNTVYMVGNVVGQFADGDVMYDNVVNAYATVESISTADGTRDISASFGSRFNQTARITLTSLSGQFLVDEYVQQEVSDARGRVVSIRDEVDLGISSPTGSFFVGQTITQTSTGANAICVFANSSYLKLSSYSNTNSFTVSGTINNGLGSSATIAAIYPVLVLNDISDVANFQAGTNTIIGSTSGARATCNNQLLIRLPDLVRDSGKLIYSESFTPVTRAPTSKEEIKLVIKF